MLAPGDRVCIRYLLQPSREAMVVTYGEHWTTVEEQAEGVGSFRYEALTEMMTKLPAA